MIMFGRTMKITNGLIWYVRRLKFSKDPTLSSNLFINNFRVLSMLLMDRLIRVAIKVSTDPFGMFFRLKYIFTIFVVVDSLRVEYD